MKAEKSNVLDSDVEFVNGYDLKLAKKGCKHCYGTGITGYLLIGKPEKKIPVEKKAPIVCSCVIKLHKEAVAKLKKEQKNAA